MANSETTNIGWTFYRGYYDSLDAPALSSNKLADDFFKSKNKTFLDTQFLEESASVLRSGNTAQDIELITTYPGMLIGSGYGHQTGTQGEFKLGFFFDHTTGLPIIAGSSVKGVLRSSFPHFETDKDNVFSLKNVTDVQINKALFIYALWKNQALDLALSDEEKQKRCQCIHKLELEIFEGLDNKTTLGNTPQYLPMTQRDIFHDAIIIKANAQKRIFGEDSITPHGDNPLKNPVPVTFMKILPNVKFRFQFDLKNTFLIDNPQNKRDLFEKLLRLRGIGAKTNVGYGQFQ